jgi:hypothetical protein
MITSWLCSDKETIRVGNRQLGIWWNVESLTLADAYIKVLNRYSDSELIALYKKV